MENEYYYRNQLQGIMETFIENETTDHSDFGWLSNDIAKNMADAAFIILKQNLDLNKFFKENDMIK